MSKRKMTEDEFVKAIEVLTPKLKAALENQNTQIAAAILDDLIHFYDVSVYDGRELDE